MVKSEQECQVTFQPGTFLFTEEGTGDEFYIIQEGEVELLKNTDDGGATRITTLGSGEILGEMGVLEDKKRSASARAQTEVTCLEIEEDDFDQLLKKSKDFRSRILNLLSSRLRRTTDRFINVLNYRQKLYRSVLVILDYIRRRNWLDRGEATIPTSKLDTDKVATRFRISEGTVETMLQTPEPEQLKDKYDWDKRQRVLDTAETLLDNILNQITIGEPSTGSDTSVDTGPPTDRQVEPDDLAEAFETLLRQVLEGPLTADHESAYKNLLRQFQSSADSIPDEDEERIQAYVQAIKQKFKQ